METQDPGRIFGELPFLEAMTEAAQRVSRLSTVA